MIYLQCIRRIGVGGCSLLVGFGCGEHMVFLEGERCVLLEALRHWVKEQREEVLRKKC